MLILLMLLQTAPATLPTTQPTLDQRRVAEQEKLRQSMHTLSALSPRTLGEVVGLSLGRDDGLLLPESPLTTTDGAHRVDLLDLPGLTQVNVGQSDTSGDRWIDFQHVDFDTPGAVSTLFQIFGRADYLMIAYDFTGVVEERRVQLIQSPRMAEQPNETVRLYVERFDAITEESIGKINLRADRFDTLLRDHPQEAIEYLLRPIFSRKLHRELLRTPAGEAWQALGDSVPPPAEVKQQVDALVVQLNSDEFSKRESAAVALQKLGPSGAMALRAVDTKLLSEEQRQAIETTLASYLRLPGEQIARLKSDKLFLIGVLYSDESSLWPAALKALGGAAKLDASLTATDVRRTADGLLEAFVDPAPTTQPSAGP